MKKMKGFTLIEIMITIAVIGILAAIAYPNYSNYAIQSRRIEGITFLLQIMQQQERAFTEQLTYSVDLTTLGYVVDATGLAASENDHYLVGAAACAGTTIDRCVELTATPQGVQAADGNMTLNSQGVRTPAAFWQ